MNRSVYSLKTINAESQNMIDPVNTDVQLRQFPYPYRAMMAICSDLDETPDRNVYYQIMRFLNTTEETSMGPGVGLEVGNSIYFDMPPDQFAYWNTDDAGREMIRTLIRSGHVDCLHSYGDLAMTRRHAELALDELIRYDCKLQVWIDHGIAATNFDWTRMGGHGDEIGHEAYHADLTIDYGIKYVWRARVTSITGQDIPADLGGIFTWKYPVQSGRTLLKETVKRRLARKGDQKYAIHGPNETIRPIRLRNESSVYEFLRCNPHWGGVSSCDQGRYIDQVLTDTFLNRLVVRGGTCILYTHLGKIVNPSVPFSQEVVEAFCRLGEAHRSGDILVTTTSRLLAYRRSMREVTYNCTSDERGLHINLDTSVVRSPIGRLSTSDLSGLTFYVADPQATCITIDGRQVKDLQCNAEDHTGRPSVSLSWPVLEFPKI